MPPDPQPEADTPSLPDGLYRAAGVTDPDGRHEAGGVLRVAAGRVMSWHADAQGEPVQDLTLPGGGAVQVLPALANAHAHLDLSGPGPRPRPGGGFLDWVRREVWPIRHVQRERPASIGEAVAQAAAASRAAGVAAVADIAGTATAAEAFVATGLTGTAYLELLGLSGERLDAARELMQQAPLPGGASGLQPHAPYSVGRTGFLAAAATGWPLTTHLAETLEEDTFIRHHRGPMVDFLDGLSIDHAGLPGIGEGLSSVQWLAPALAAAPGRWLVAHCNHIDDADIATLSETRTTVAYCPVASDYFGEPRGGRHRYRDLLDAGVRVVLGTDSVLCQPPDEPQPHGILAQVRHLHRRDGADPGVLLRMACRDGFAALGLEPPNDRMLLVPGATLSTALTTPMPCLVLKT